MTIINGDITNVALKTSRQPIIFTVSEPRLGANGTSTIESTSFTVKPVSGAFSVNLDPGPVTVLFGGKEYNVTVPASGPVDFWDLIAAAVAEPASTSADIIAGIVADALTGYASTSYVDEQLELIPSTPDATSVLNGKIRLAGDLAGTAAAPTVPGLAGKHPVISRGRSFWTKFQTGYNCVIAVAGDSTSNDTNEWFYRLAQLIAPLRANTLVRHRLWNDGTQAYSAETTIQAGSGAPICDFYNGSMPGAALSYHLTRIAIMYPVEPDILFVNSGHNYGTDTPATHQAALDTFIAEFKAVWPNTAIVISSQNPEFSPATNAAAHNLRNASLSRYAEQRGYGYVAAAEGFSDLESGGSGHVLADGIHPNSLGSDIWRDNALSFLRSIDVERLTAGSLSLSGGTLTGDLTISRDASTTTLKVDSDPGRVTYIVLSSDGLGRWRVAKTATAESGSDAGSNFELHSMTDAGAQKTVIIAIDRSNGRTTFRGDVTFLKDAAAATTVWDTDPGQAANLSFRSNNSERWAIQKTATAEGGSNAGSDLSILARTDAGAALATVAAFIRSTGQAQLTAYPVKVHSAVTGSRPTASAAGVGAHMFDTTLNRPIWSTGSAWVDATGAAV